MEWCKAEPLGAVITPPFTNSPDNRSRQNLLMVLDQFPLESERYRSRDVTGDGRKETFCNFFTRDVSRAMGTPLPEGKTANQIHAMLNAGELPEFTKVTKLEASLRIELGQFVFAIAAGTTGPGHMVPCREVFNGTIFCDHVGGHNVRRLPVSMAMGYLAERAEFWVSK